jgi:hypothetical protein
MQAQPLISDSYRAAQAELHRDPNYGVASLHWAPTVADLARQIKPKRILDYGAGKGRLGIELKKLLQIPFDLVQYDPSVPEFAASPAPCDLVACIDVLEHIEPDCLDAVLDDLKRVTARVGIYTIATGPAMKTLPDGRNAHLIQQGPAWWVPKLFARFRVRSFADQGETLVVIVTPA